MTTALAPLSNVAKLVAVAQRYVADTPAPEPSEITLYPATHHITIQPDHVYPRDAVGVIGALLIWTHKLTGLTGQWWHVPTGDLHIHLIGRGPSGVSFKVYGSFPYRYARKHLTLHKGDSESVTPDELYRLALEIRATRTEDEQAHG